MVEKIASSLAEIDGQVSQLLERAGGEIASAATAEGLDKLRIHYLGRSGEITLLVRSVGQVPPEQRREVGQVVNRAKQQVEQLLADRRTTLEAAQSARGIAKDALDVTLPGLRRLPGHVHPVTATMERMKEIMIGLGFSYDDYPE
ncbi:MAG TPA: hypothetical protein VGV38_13940, partial [Pyrinomonadaceae bacterium]|nr:hypothetical protein [Pyrinomonadaceae bacterium]